MTLDEFKARAKNDLDRAFEAGKAQGGGEDKYEQGVQAEHNRLWDEYQSNGTRTHYAYGFAGYGWNDATYNPKYEFGKVTYANYMFASSNITDTKHPIDFTNATSTIYSLCAGSTLLKKIRTITLKATNVLSTPFSNCTSLEEIDFIGEIGCSLDFNACTKLNAQSIDNIFNHLGGTTSNTLALPATAQETYDAVYNKGAFETKVNARPTNWTVAY